MKTTLKLALGAVLSAVVIVPAVAQDNFPDVPGEHWAYEALARMKREGLLVGYPDGLFRGNRPASRYEMAVAIHATYAHLKGLIDGINSQIEELKGMKGGASDAEMQAMRDALSALQNDVNNMKSWGDDIANLKKMASMFEKELASLGVNVDQMKQELADLESRVGKLEKNQMPVTIHGDVTMFAIGGISDDNKPYIGQDGRVYGWMAAPGGPAGFTEDLNVFHEAALTIAGTNETGPKWAGTFVFGNGLGSGQAGVPGAVGTGSTVDEGSSDMWVDSLSVKFDTSLAGQGFSAELGRFGYSIAPYIFMRQDTNPYYANSRMDDGKWRIDGANLGFGFGNATLNVIGGRMGNIKSVNGTDQQGRGGVGTMFGAHLGVPVTENGKLNLAYLWLQSEAAGAGGFGRGEIYGGDLTWKMDRFNLAGGYSVSNLRVGGTDVIDEDNASWYVKGSFGQDRWGVGGGYRHLGGNFFAPGDWGRVAFVYNPVDHDGFHVNGWFQLTDAAKLSASGEWYEGLDDNDGGAGNFLNDGDKINRYTANLDYKMNDSWSAMLGGEWVEIDLVGSAPKPQFRWYNIGFGYTMSDMAKLNFMWQLADHDTKTATGTLRGSLLSTQLTVKF